MKYRVILMAIALGTVFSVAETLTKDSAPFEFPMSGIERGKTFQQNMQVELTSKIITEKVVMLSWSIPGNITTGELSLFSPSGKILKAFEISKNQGGVVWDLNKNSLSYGVFLAVVRAGNFSKEFKLAIVK